MSRFESIIIKLLIYFFIPLGCFVLFWWGSATIFLLDIFPVSENNIAISAFLGLAIGVGLIIVFGNKLYKNFYSIKARYLIFSYLFFSLIGFAFFMGVPVLYLAIGTLAGMYIGRRFRFHQKVANEFAHTLNKASLAIAALSAGFALLTGLASLSETSVTDFLNSIFSIINLQAVGLFGILLAIIYAVLIFTLQYFLTKKAGILGFRF